MWCIPLISKRASTSGTSRLTSGPKAEVGGIHRENWSFAGPETERLTGYRLPRTVCGARKPLVGNTGAVGTL